MPQNEYRNTFQFQISAYFIGLTILIVNLVSWVLYFQVQGYFDDDLGKTLIGIAQSSADLMEADLLEFLAPGSEEGRFYLSLQEHLQLLERDFNASRVYVVDISLQVLVDSHKGQSIGNSVPHLQSNMLEINKALGGEAAYSTLYRGSEGDLYKSAFAPVRDTNGEIRAIACVDASPDFLQVMDNIRNTILIIGILSLLVAIALAVFLSKSIVNPLKLLVRAAQRIGGGDYSTAVRLEARNELGFLGSIFNTMQDNIQSHQQSLVELKQLAESRADKLELYNNYILQSVDNGILTISLDGVVTVVNAKAGKLLQINPVTAIGMDFDAVFDRQNPFRERIELDRQDPARSDLIELTVSHQEQQAVLAVQSSPLRDTDNQVIGMNWVITDVTELRQLQKEIEEKERMAYLGMLSAAVAHEIRNPLNSIELFIGLLKRQLGDDSDSLVSIEKIREEIKALNSIVTNILVFAKPGVLQSEVFPVARLLQESLFLAENALLTKNIHSNIKLPDEELHINGDIHQLKQAVLNIILNSVEAMEAGGNLALSAREVAANDRQPWLEIRICDDGDGIAEADLDRVFDPFYSTRSQGTGLGLSIVRNIVQAHRGKVAVASSPDQGTVFILDLPKGDN